MAECFFTAEELLEDETPSGEVQSLRAGTEGMCWLGEWLAGGLDRMMLLRRSPVIH